MNAWSVLQTAIILSCIQEAWSKGKFFALLMQ